MSSSTSLSDNSNENNDYTPGTTYEVQKHDVLYSSTTCYQVIDFSGEGSFGKVARCVNLTTGTKVAVKIHKENGDVSKTEKNDKSDPQAIEADSMASLHFDEACPEKRTSTPFFSREDFLQVNHEELQVADVISEEKFPNELQVEKNKNNLLQEELERICISYQLLIARYEDDVLKNREQTDALRHDLDNEILQKKQLQSQFDEATAALREERQNLEREVEQKKLLRTAYEELQEKHKVDQAKNNTLQQEVDSLQHEIHNLRAEKEALRQKMAEEMTILQQNAFFKEKIFVRELDE
ncbi:hypothetical protein GBF38_013325, partial [Nibea albiflora]